MLDLVALAAARGVGTIDPLAVYAAIVATIALLWTAGWSVYTWTHSHHLRLRLTAVSDTNLTPEGLIEQIFTFALHNNSAFPIRLREFGVFGRTQAGEVLTHRRPAIGGEPIAAGDEFRWAVNYTDLADFGFDLSSGVQGWVHLVGGHPVYSRVIQAEQRGVLAIPSAVPRLRPPDDDARQAPPPHSRWRWRRWGKRAFDSTDDRVARSSSPARGQRSGWMRPSFRKAAGPERHHTA